MGSPFNMRAQQVDNSAVDAAMSGLEGFAHLVGDDALDVSIPAPNVAEKSPLSKTSVVLDSGDGLPEGWSRKVVKRGGGQTEGRYDIYVHAPGVRFRSAKALINYLETHPVDGLTPEQALELFSRRNLLESPRMILAREPLPPSQPKPPKVQQRYSKVKRQAGDGSSQDSAPPPKLPKLMEPRTMPGNFSGQLGESSNPETSRSSIFMAKPMEGGVKVKPLAFLTGPIGNASLPFATKATQEEPKNGILVTKRAEEAKNSTLYSGKAPPPLVPLDKSHGNGLRSSIPLASRLLITPSTATNSQNSSTNLSLSSGVTISYRAPPKSSGPVPKSPIESQVIPSSVGRVTVSASSRKEEQPRPSALPAVSVVPRPSQQVAEVPSRDLPRHIPSVVSVKVISITQVLNEGALLAARAEPCHANEWKSMLPKAKMSTILLRILRQRGKVSHLAVAVDDLCRQFSLLRTSCDSGAIYRCAVHLTRNMDVLRNIGTAFDEHITSHVCSMSPDDLEDLEDYLKEVRLLLEDLSMVGCIFSADGAGKRFMDAFKLKTKFVYALQGMQSDVIGGYLTEYMRAKINSAISDLQKASNFPQFVAACRQIIGSRIIRDPVDVYENILRRDETLPSGVMNEIEKVVTGCCDVLSLGQWLVISDVTIDQSGIRHVASSAEIRV